MGRLDKDNPCKPDCPDRTVNPNCHSTCEKYLNWKEYIETEKKKIREYNVKNSIKNTKLYTAKAIHTYKKYHKTRKDGY